VFIYIFDSIFFFEFQNPFKTMLQATARTSTLVFIFTFVSKILLAQPANDNFSCGVSPLLTPSSSCTTTSGDLYQSTNSGITSTCGTTYDVWYRFTTPSGCTAVDIDVTPIAAGGNNLTAANTFIQVFSVSTCTLTPIGSCTALGTTLTLTGLSPSTTYYTRVFVTTNPNSQSGKWDFDICVTYTPPPANDDWGGATTLTSATTCSNIAGTIMNATVSSGLTAGCEAAGTHYDVWYKFVATNNAHTVAISGQGSNFTNPELQLYSNTLGSITCGTTSLTSSVLTIGSTYYVRVSNIGSSPASNGGFNICVTNPAPPVLVAAGRMNEVYKQTTLSGSGVLQYPWEITYGPDNNLWITESRGYKVYKMDPNTGIKTTVLDISLGSTWLPSPSDSLNVQFNSNWPQGGLAGLAIHPNFLDGTGLHDYVYISYVHRNLGGSSPTGLLFRNKLVRFTYNSGTGKLGSPAVICDTLPGSNDHNSQRIIIAPITVGGTNYLFYASGDMGAGQFSNRTRPNNAQNPASYEGKILRFNIDTVGGLPWVPADNPYSSTSAVWSIGLRNNQGFAYNPSLNILYGASHGPYSDDEINIIQGFKNYGHPLIEGFVDGNYDGSAVQGTDTSVSAGASFQDGGGVSSCPPIGSEAANKIAIDGNGNGLYKDPLFSAYPVAGGPITTPGTVKYIWKNNPGNANPAPGWPTEAWSGLDLYTHTLVPGWKNSLVAASLKWGRLLKIKLNVAGTQTSPTNTYNDTTSYLGSQNRFRDLAFSPDGKDIFVVMDNSSTTSGPGSANPVVPNCLGCVQKYTFLGYYDNAGKSSIPTSIDVTDGTVNSCNTGTTITINSDNSNLWVPITGPDGNIMAEIYPNGNILGTVTSSFYKNSGAIRNKNGTHYLDRNMTITPQFQPATPVKIRLYMSKTEFDALDADGLSGVGAISDLKILKNTDACSNAISAATTLITPTYAEAHGANGYMLQGDIPGFSSFYFASSNVILPLQLLTFTGSLQSNSDVLLNWKTENEINTSHFIIERSLDGSNFASIGRVAAIGNSNNTTNSYVFTDNDAANQQSLLLYYRLRMVDADGRFTYSSVITIRFADITATSASVFPNPARNEATLSVSSASDMKIQWQLLDNTGRILINKNVMLKDGVNNITINLSHFSSGTYFIKLSGDNINQIVKLQKQ
jgi:PQQ-dependent dehydrogenase (s-GDH family)